MALCFANSLTTFQDPGWWRLDNWAKVQVEAAQSGPQDGWKNLENLCFSMGHTSSKEIYFPAMLVYQRVYIYIYMWPNIYVYTYTYIIYIYIYIYMHLIFNRYCPGKWTSLYIYIYVSWESRWAMKNSMVLNWKAPHYFEGLGFISLTIPS